MTGRMLDLKEAQVSKDWWAKEDITQQAGQD
jgi:hypothetical protein